MSEVKLKLLLEFVDEEPYLDVNLTEEEFYRLKDNFFVTSECFLEDKKINLGIFITQDEEYAIKKR